MKHLLKNKTPFKNRSVGFYILFIGLIINELIIHIIFTFYLCNLLIIIILAFVNVSIYFLQNPFFFKVKYIFKKQL